MEELRSEVLFTARIELERMFTVLANKYSNTPDEKHKPPLQELETIMTKSLEQFSISNEEE